MSAYSFEDLRRHVGHEIECVVYGKPTDPVNVAVECETCFEVLLDFDRHSDIED
jgi:hypothetical protein